MNRIHRCLKNRHAATLTALVATAAAVTLVLPGCGGGAPLGDAAVAPTSAPVAAPAAAHSTPTAATAATTETASIAEPIDGGARTRQGRYLTGEQARALALRLDNRLVHVQAQCCGPEAAELDALVAFGVQAASDLPSEAPFVVSGNDLRQAAAVANRLSELGASEVHLVTR